MSAVRCTQNETKYKIFMAMYKSEFAWLRQMEQRSVSWDGFCEILSALHNWWKIHYHRHFKVGKTFLSLKVFTRKSMKESSLKDSNPHNTKISKIIQQNYQTIVVQTPLNQNPHKIFFGLSS